MHHKALTEAVASGNAGFNVKKIFVKNLKKGFIVFDSKKAQLRKLPNSSLRLLCSTDNYLPVLKFFSAHIPCKLTTNKSFFKSQKYKDRISEDCRSTLHKYNFNGESRLVLKKSNR